MSFSIGEFSELVDIPSSTLRFYEKEGLITPERDKNNLRTYSEEDANWLKFLLHLKGAGIINRRIKTIHHLARSRRQHHFRTIEYVEREEGCFGARD